MSSNTYRKKGNFGLMIICALAIVSVFVKIVPTTVLMLLILVSQFLFQNSSDRSFVFLLLYGVYGSFFANIGIRFVGVVLMILGAVVLLPDILKKSGCIGTPLLKTVIILAFLFLSAILSTGGGYAMAKISGTVLAAVLFFIAYCHLLLYPNKHDGMSLSLMLLTCSAFMMGFLTDFTGGMHISEVFSFGSFRLSWGEMKDDDQFVYNYQQIGFYSLIALCMLFNRNNSKLDWKGWTVLLACGLIVLGSQSRQSIFSFFIVVLFLLLDVNRFSARSLILGSLVILFVYLWINSLDADKVNFIFGQEELETYSQRSMIRTAAINSFLENPIFGVGFGRFSFDNSYGVNEHNIFLEILAETGIVGLLLFFILSVSSFTKVPGIKLKGDYKWLVAIMIVSLLRYMVSSDLRESIGLFVLIILLPLVMEQYKQIENC